MLQFYSMSLEWNFEIILITMYLLFVFPGWNVRIVLLNRIQMMLKWSCSETNVQPESSLHCQAIWHIYHGRKKETILRWAFSIYILSYLIVKKMKYCMREIYSFAWNFSIFLKSYRYFWRKAKKTQQQKIQTKKNTHLLVN